MIELSKKIYINFLWEIFKNLVLKEKFFKTKKKIFLKKFFQKLRKNVFNEHFSKILFLMKIFENFDFKDNLKKTDFKKKNIENLV